MAKSEIINASHFWGKVDDSEYPKKPITYLASFGVVTGFVIDPYEPVGHNEQGEEQWTGAQGIFHVAEGPEVREGDAVLLQDATIIPWSSPTTKIHFGSLLLFHDDIHGIAEASPQV